MTEPFTPDILLPEQYQLLGRSTYRQGEIRLLYALLQDAIECFQKGVGATGRHTVHVAQEAEQWLFTDDERWPFSFLNICRVLGIHPGYLRRRLLLWREQHLAQLRTHAHRL